MELPLKKIPATLKDPKNLIIYGTAKVGKTTLLSTLDNALIIDLEDGSDYIDALKIKIKTFQELIELCKTIKEADSPYNFIAIDTITALERMAEKFALARYLKEEPSFNKTIWDVPYGNGYKLFREAFMDLIGYIKKVTKNVILVGHVKDKSVLKVDSQDEALVKDISLQDKVIPGMISQDSDAIAFCYRDLDSNLVMDFTNGGSVVAGARQPHLANKKIIVAEYNSENNSFTSHWERIYPSLNDKK